MPELLIISTSAQKSVEPDICKIEKGMPAVCQFPNGKKEEGVIISTPYRYRDRHRLHPSMLNTSWNPWMVRAAVSGEHDIPVTTEWFVGEVR